MADPDSGYLAALQPILDGKTVIARAFSEFCQVRADPAGRFADAVIARLAALDPPVLLAYPDELSDGPDEVQVAALLRLCADALDALDAAHLEGAASASPVPARNPTPPVGAGLPLRRVTDSPQA